MSLIYPAEDRFVAGNVVDVLALQATVIIIISN